MRAFAISQPEILLSVMRGDWVHSSPEDYKIDYLDIAIKLILIKNCGITYSAYFLRIYGWLCANLCDEVGVLLFDRA